MLHDQSGKGVWTVWVRALSATVKTIPAVEGIKTFALKTARIGFAVLLLLTLTSAAVAVAQQDPSPGPAPGLPEASEIAEAAGEGRPPVSQAPDTAAAEDLDLEDLGRQEALNVLSEVFDKQLQGPAGVFDDLEWEKLLSPNVAVIPTGEGSASGSGAGPSEQETPEGSADFNPDDPIKKESDGILGVVRASEIAPTVADAALLASTIPLTDPEEGHAVDLTLERDGDFLSPSNPLVDLRIPNELGDGFRLSAQQVTVSLEGAPESSSPSIMAGDVAMYPNVAPDTDLLIAPTPTGVETLTHLRSPDAPLTQTFNLTIPGGATLNGTEGGGAEVVDPKDGIILNIPRPTAIDAAGRAVPVDLTVVGSSKVSLSVTPDHEAVYPILVDPLYQTYSWAGSKSWMSGICNSSYKEETFSACNTHEEWSSSLFAASFPPPIELLGQFYGGSPSIPQGQPGLFIRSSNRPLTISDWSSWNYTVPRYFSDYERYGTRPSSYIRRLKLWSVLWQAYSSYPSPYLSMGLWAPEQGQWLSFYEHTGQVEHGLNDLNWVYDFRNDPTPAEQTAGWMPRTDVKMGMVGVGARETRPSGNVGAFVGAASIELGDVTPPQPPIVTGPVGWFDKTAPGIAFQAADLGLGVFALKASTEQVGGDGQPIGTWTRPNGCAGVGDWACPRYWKSTDPGEPKISFDPSALPTGVRYINVIAQDPVGNTSSASYAEVQVDHTAPFLLVTGTATEQATLGTKRPSYSLRVRARDGIASAPQSGIDRLVVEIDGEVVGSTKPACKTQNCEAFLEVPIDSNEYGTGTHSVRVTAADAVGLAAVPSAFNLVLTTSDPAVRVGGTIVEQAELGTSRPRYSLDSDATAIAGLAAAAPIPTFSKVVGTVGTGSGQFSHPADIARDDEGNLWVVDEINNRIQKFTSEGSYISQFGSPGSVAGQFNRPTAIAIDPSGNLWVTDAGNARVQKFNNKGQVLVKFGVPGTAVGQFAGAGPEGIAVDEMGNVYVSDTYGGRIQKFSSTGVFQKVIGTKGAGVGQLMEPTGLEVSADGGLVVSDWSSNKVVQFNSAGAYVRQFGSAGAGNSQFQRPDGVAVDGRGHIFVIDTGNSRIQEFDRTGGFLKAFGKPGTENDRLAVSYPVGVTTTPSGELWLTDSGNNRIQRWTLNDYKPLYTASVGSPGSGPEQFQEAADAAVDPKGRVWVVDKSSDRIQVFSDGGSLLMSFGTAGTGNGQFNNPSAIAADPKGNLWVADTGNDRIQEFNENGAFLRKSGSFGTGNGQFDSPEGIAVDAKGNVWVSDTGNARLQSFSEAGAFLKKLTESKQESLREPGALEVSPTTGNILVADRVKGRVSVLTESGTFIRQFGAAETEAGQNTAVTGLSVDLQGNTWISDSGHGCVQVFTERGRAVASYGDPGSGIGQFAVAGMGGIAVAATGGFWVVDGGNDRLQHWTPVSTRSQIQFSIALDSQQLFSGTSNCNGEVCRLAKTLFINPGSVTPGSHTLLLKATDGLGNTTTRPLGVSFAPDLSKPHVEIGGALPSAPEGWVEQDAYGLTVEAQDEGYGVTSLAVKIDGQEIASQSSPCPDGGCSLNLAKGIDMAAFEGGSHDAVVTAVDGAGNQTSSGWTINVDPEGNISTAEARATLEAADETGESVVVASTAETLEPGQIELGDNPSLHQAGSVIESAGTPDTTVMGTSPSEGFELHTPDDVLQVIPAVQQAATSVGIVQGAAALAANTGVEVDSVVRPQYNGAQTFQAIRSPSAPNSFSWTVDLSGSQTLRLLDAKTAEVIYGSGHRAFLITAGEAHDAIGTAVPTTLEVSGSNTITLNVNHQTGAFVYPVISGTGWEGGYAPPVVIQGPEDEAEIKEREKEELAAQGPAEAAQPPAPPPAPVPQPKAKRLVMPTLKSPQEISAPPVPAPGGATASLLRVFTIKPFRICQIDHCGIWYAELKNPSFERGINWAHWEPGTEVHCHSDVGDAYAFFLGTEADNQGCDFVHGGTVYKGENRHLTIWARWNVSQYWVSPYGDAGVEENLLAQQVWVWPNGFQQNVLKHWQEFPEVIEN